MRNRIAQTVEKLLVDCPAILNQPMLLHRLFLRKKVAVLMYHGVVETPLEIPDWCFISKHDFSLQMEYLHRNFKIISLAQAVQSMREEQINEPTAVITFDDGYQNVHDVAYPVMSRLGIPATVFLNTGFTDTANTLWFCRLNMAISATRCRKLSWNGQEYDLSSRAARTRTCSRLQSRLKQLPHQQLLDNLDVIREALGIQTADEAPKDSPFRILDSQSIGKMAASGLIEFGAHTATHTILTRVSEERARQEILSSIGETQRLTSKPCTLFAYPNGRAVDYNDIVMKFLGESGVQAAVTTREGPNTSSTPPLELRRYGIGAGLSLVPFILRVHHLLPGN
jgi:hypothetical protein